jgi:oligosaccharide repeat unit polymerase
MIQKSRNNWIVVLIQSYILIGLILFGLVYAANPSGFMFSVEASFQILCHLFLLLVPWIFGSWYWTTKRIFDPYLLFILSAILFNGGQIILEVFHLNENGFLDNRFPLPESLQVVYIVILSLSALHWGGLLCAVLDLQKKHAAQFSEFVNRNSGTILYLQSGIEQSLNQDRPFYYPSRIKKFAPAQIIGSIPPEIALFIGQIFLYLSIIPVVVTVAGAVQIAKAGGYGSLFEQQAATGFAASASVMADFIFPGVFLIIAGGKRKPSLRIFAVIYLLGYTVAKFTIGSRGAAVMPLLSMLWLWNSVVRPIPRTLLATVAAILLLVVFPVIGATRNDVAGVDLFSIEFLTKTITNVNNPLVASISEMGFSATTIAWTMELVPKVRPFDLGMSFLVSILTLIPNVFTSGRHPALTMSGYDTPDYWLVGVIDPVFASQGGGLGFSFISEAYLNAGWFGIFILGIIGFLFAKFVQWAVQDGDPVKMGIIAIFVSFFLVYPRASSQLVTRPLIWYCLFPYLWMQHIDRVNRSKEKD